MMKGRNNGKKLLAVRIVAHAFEIIHLLTDQNPIQVGLCYMDLFSIQLQQSITGSRWCHCEHRPSRRLYSHRFARHRPSPSRRCVPSTQSQPIHCPSHHRSMYIRSLLPSQSHLDLQTRESAFRNVKSIAECLADELINAAKGSSNSYAIKVGICPPDKL